MVKHSPIARNRKTETICTSVPSLSLPRDARKRLVGQANMSLAGSHLSVKEKQLKGRCSIELPVELAECNASDRKTPGSCDDREKHMSPEPASMLGGRVMQLKLYRVSLESASEAIGKPGSAPASKASRGHHLRCHGRQTSRSSNDATGHLPPLVGLTLQTSGAGVERPIKPKKHCGTFRVSSSSVNRLYCPRKQRSRRGIRSMFTKRANVSKKCNIVTRRLSCIPSNISAVKEVADVTASSASLQRTSMSTTCDVSESIPPYVRRRGRPKKFSAVPPGDHERHFVDLDNEDLSAESCLANHPRQEVPSSQPLQGGLIANSKDDADALATKHPVFSGRPRKVACNNSFQTAHVDGKMPRPSSQRPVLQRERSDLKENRLGHPKRRVGRPRKHPVPETTSSEDTVCPSRVVKPSATRDCRLQHEPSLTNSSQAKPEEHVPGTLSNHRSGKEDGKASRVTRSGRPKDCAAFQANILSSDLPKKTESISVFPIKTEVMAVIYPCEALSVYLPSKVMAPQTRQKASQEPKELCPHEAPKEHLCNGASVSSADQSVSQEVHGPPSSAAASRSDLPKRRPGRPKKRRVRPRQADTTLSPSSSVAEVTSQDCSLEQVVPQQAVDPQTMQQAVSQEAEEARVLGETKENHKIYSSWATQSVHEKGRIISSSTSATRSDLPKRSPGRPIQKCRQKAVATLGDLTSAAKPTSLDGNHDQVVPEQPDDPRKTKQQAPKEAKEPCFGEPKQNQCNDIPICSTTQCTRQRDRDICSSVSASLSVQPKRRRDQPKKQRSGEESAAAILGSKVSPASAEASFVHGTKVLQREQKIKCSVVNDNDRKQKKRRGHTSASQTRYGPARTPPGTCSHDREKSGARCKTAADVEGRTSRRPAENSSQPSPVVCTGSQLKEEQTTNHRRSELTDAGDSPVVSGQEAGCLDGRVLQVKLLPLAVVLGLELASQTRGGSCVSGMTSSSSEQQAPPRQRQGVPKMPLESTAQEDALNQGSVTEESAPTREGKDAEPSWMGRGSSPSTYDFKGFTKDELFRTHGVDSKVCYRLVIPKGSCEDEGSGKSLDVAPLAAAALSTPPITAGVDRYRCDHCNFESSIREKWENHVRRRHGYLVRKRKHTCEKCPYSTKYLGDLKRHYTKHTGERPFPCSVCGKRFVRSSILKTHTLIHTAEKTFICETCGNAYRTAHLLKYHQKVHTEEKPYRCDFCEMTFRHQDKLVRHVRKHTGEKPFQCVHCGTRFSTTTSLLHHIRTHTGEKPYRCDICGKAFAIHCNLVDHTYSHLEERNFKCDYCKKSFKAKKFLVTHMKVHTGEKCHVCTVCGKGFLRASSLEMHLRTHTGERPFSCDICGKSFKEKNLLKEHFLFHTREKPIKCETCGLMFRYTGSLRAHTKHFHKEVKCESAPPS